MNIGTKISNCTNFATVEGEYGVGGIVGGTLGIGLRVTQCLNFGNVCSEDKAGGIIGTFKTGDLQKGDAFEENSNYGFVLGKNDAGGMAGYWYVSIPMISCINGNTAVVKSLTSTSAAGGLIGSGRGTISNSLNLGNVESGYVAGGILGNSYDWTATMKNCYSSGNISGTYPGGLLGKRNWGGTGAATGTNCYYLLSETVTNSVGKSGQSMNSTALEKLTETEINVLNNYIENDPDAIGTTNWKKWELDNDGNPNFVK